MSQDIHYSVLLQGSVDALVINPSGVYLDGTFGRGGHSREILSRLNQDGRLIAFDKDPEAVAVAKTLEQEDSRFSIYHGSFAEIQTALAQADIEKVDGLVLDLGVSSPQLDQAERGFSFLRDGPLDMRMNNQQGMSAADWIAEAKEEDIAFVLKEFGEERFAKRLANAIVNAREEEKIERTERLAKIIKDAHPRWEKGKHPATKSFQAIRIFINAELDDLEKALKNSLEVLMQGGRLVVISFHSLEDRMVKRFFKEGAKGKSFPPEVPVTEDMLGKTLKLVGKAIKAEEAELQENIRSRSAVMRVAERL